MPVLSDTQRAWLTDCYASELVHAAEQAADAARAIVKPLFRSKLVASAKTDGSPVTIADKRAELEMRTVLAALYPDFGILGEEYGLDRPGASLRWVLDPIDGTRSFITGRPIFGTLIALMDEGVPVLGIIDQPITGERWIGLKGRPTQYTGSLGGEVGTRKVALLSQAEMSCTAPDMIASTDFSNWQNLSDSVRRVSWGGDCYAYGLLSLGQIDIVAEGDLKVWDWAAIQPIVEGAGGAVVDWAGDMPQETGDGRILAVGDAALLPKILRILNA